MRNLTFFKLKLKFKKKKFSEVDNTQGEKFSVSADEESSHHAHWDLSIDVLKFHEPLLLPLLLLFIVIILSNKK